MSEPAVVVDHLWKSFRLYHEKNQFLKAALLRGKRARYEDFWALQDVSFEISHGSTFGIIGSNGSGKSTLLKCLTGILSPDKGLVTTNGEIAALLELGAGFHPDMTGRENIALNGSILGLPRKEINAVTDEIIEFSGLGDFINDPVKHYSSGMYVRLGFAVAVHMKPDVLLVDEVLAVGDEEFQRKCFDHLYRLRRSGRTIIVVSHGLGQLEGLCDEIAWLEHGRMMQHGQAVDTIAAYLRKVNEDEAARNPMVTATREGDLGARAGDQTIRVTKAEVVSTEGQVLSHAETGTTFAIRVHFTADDRVLGPNIRLAFQHDSGSLVTMLSNHQQGVDFDWVQGSYVADMALDGNPLLPGRYRVHIDVFDHTGSRLLDNWNDAVEFAVRSAAGEMGQGFVRLPGQITLNKVD